MSDIKFKLEFTTRANYLTLEPVTNASYSSFFNTYAAWDTQPTVQRRITPRYRLMLQAGRYAVLATAANPAGTLVKCNGAQIKIYNPTDNISRTADNGFIQIYESIGPFVNPVSRVPNISTIINHPGGTFDIVIDSTSAGNLNGVAVTISPVTDTSTVAGTTIIPRSGSFVNLENIFRTIGPEVWSTRTPQSEFNGRYIFTLPYSASIEAHVWGAGGSGGAGSGNGSNWYGGSTYYAPPGGSGSPGLYNTQTFAVAPGDVIEVFVGSAGRPGTVTRGANAVGGNTPGGDGGASRTLVGGVAAQSYNGGRGGLGGRAGLVELYFKQQLDQDGGTGGGGGGGASGVLVNNSPAIVAGGGGGGGGSGIAPDFAVNGSQGFGDSNAAITKNAIGATPGDNRGENGRDVGANDVGGGGGGGGGGYPGGQGGQSRASLNSLGFHYGFRPLGGTGFHGQCGGNYPAYPASTGAGTLYYDATYGQGGAGGLGTALAGYTSRTPGIPFGGTGAPIFTNPEPGKPGTDGRAVLIVEPTGLMSVKAGGQWTPISNVYYKVSGTWKSVTELFYKDGDNWKQITGGGLIPTATENTTDYGTNARPYS
jgi:hypothetical protein